MQGDLTVETVKSSTYDLVFSCIYKHIEYIFQENCSHSFVKLSTYGWVFSCIYKNIEYIFQGNCSHSFVPM